MRAAGLALACVVVGGGIAFGYIAADREVFAGVAAFDFFRREPRQTEAKVYPSANRDFKRDRVAPAEPAPAIPEQNVLQRGDSLRQSYAAVEPAAAAPKPPVEATLPLPKPRPKVQLLRRQQASYTLLSDLQIDAIRARLKLTPEQERNWPAVEAALRGLSMRLHDMKTSGTAPTDLGPDSAELARLKTAATPFFAQLNTDQKRELRALAHIIGLGKVVAQL